MLGSVIAGPGLRGSEMHSAVFVHDTDYSLVGCAGDSTLWGEGGQVIRISKRVLPQTISSR